MKTDQLHELLYEVGKPPRTTETRAPIEIAPSLSILRRQPRSAVLAECRRPLFRRRLVVGSAHCASGAPEGGRQWQGRAPHGGTVRSDAGESVPVDHGLNTVSSTLFDGLALPGGPESVSALLATPGAVTFVVDAFRHRKAIGASREAAILLEAGGLDGRELRAAEGVVFSEKPRIKLPDAGRFITALARHRHWARVVPPKLGP